MNSLPSDFPLNLFTTAEKPTMNVRSLATRKRSLRSFCRVHAAPPILNIEDLVRTDGGQLVNVKHLVTTRARWRQRPEFGTPGWVSFAYGPLIVAYRVEL